MSRPIGRLVVIGAGMVGLAAAWAAARSGFAVTCVEAVTVGHPKGSSAGPVKVLRYAYEDLKFAKLLVEGEYLWRRLEAMSGAALVQRCVGLNIGEAGSHRLRSMVASLEEVGRDYEILPPGHPCLAALGLRLWDHETAVLELEAGLIVPSRAIAAIAAECRRSGVQIVEGVRAVAVDAVPGGIRVTTDRGDLETDRLIVATGPWLPELVNPPAVEVTVTRQEQVIFSTSRPVGDGEQFTWVDLTDDEAYGVTNMPVGRHVFGVHAPGPPVAGPQGTATADRDTVTDRLAAFHSRFVDDVKIDVVESRLCHYTNTVSGDFEVSRWPALDGAILLNACSGHGFKFALINGQRAADLAKE